MNLLEVIILGIIQGLTEFIPISSSGHLVLAQRFFNSQPDHLFIEFINIGTVLALIIYFWPRIKQLLKDVFIYKNWKLARNIIISAIPAGFLGLLLANFIEENPFFSNPWVVIIMLFVIGVFLVVLEKLPRFSLVKSGDNLSNKRALMIGIAQVAALIPGTSRSGATIIAGRLAGLSPAAAAEYSFLLSIPIMLGVITKLLLTDQHYLWANLPAIALSNIFAFISGLLAVGFLMKYLAKHNVAVFGWYRIILAVVVAVVLLIQ